MNIRKWIIALVFLIAGGFAFSDLNAQPNPAPGPPENPGGGRPGGGPPGGGPGGPPPPRVPISGVEILLLAGGAFGIKKIIDTRKKGQTT